MYLLGWLGLPVFSITLDGSGTTHVVLLQGLPLDWGGIGRGRDSHGGEEESEDVDEEIRTHGLIVKGF